jgi:hypothetical protein
MMLSTLHNPALVDKANERQNRKISRSRDISKDKST